MRVIHFCEVPQTAMCGEYLASDNYQMFYKNTTNLFSAITCGGWGKDPTGWGLDEPPQR